MSNTDTTSHIQQLQEHLNEHILGQKDLIENLLIAFFSGGHVLLEGPPGLAKTKTIKTLSALLGTSFSRIQFTPDLLPSDLIGSEIFRQNTGEFEVRKGPIFSHIILADEINRAPSKVQSALLEAMEERQVTIGNQSWKLEEPFIVLATQNPLEQEGTYALSEAQVDRFLMKLIVDYPDKESEIQILSSNATSKEKPIKKLLSKKKIQEIMRSLEGINVDEKIYSYVTEIIRYSRPEHDGDSMIASYVRHGVSPRAGISLIRSARVRALMQGRAFVLPEDIKALAHQIFRHRIILSYQAYSDKVDVDSVIETCLNRVSIP